MKRLKIKKININIGNRNMLMLFIVFFFGIALIYKYQFTSQNNFISGNYILSLMSKNGNYGLLKDGWTATADFYNFINFFKIKSLLEWSLYIIAICFLVIYAKMQKKLMCIKYTLSMGQFIYLCSVLFLLGVYVLCLSKDLLQFIVFLILDYIIYGNLVKKPAMKLILTIIVFSLLSVVFKPYYILFGIFTGVIYVLFKYVFKKDKLTFLKKILIIAGLVFGAVFLFMLIASVLYPQGYNELIRARSSSTDILSANTEISDIIVDKSGNTVIWMVNYLVGLVRMLFPLELLMKKISYFPFVVYQLLMTAYIIKNIVSEKGKDKKNVLTISVMLAFIVVSGMFEPDFGSWVRHGTTTFFLLNELVFV